MLFEIDNMTFFFASFRIAANICFSFLSFCHCWEVTSKFNAKSPQLASPAKQNHPEKVYEKPGLNGIEAPLGICILHPLSR